MRHEATEVFLVFILLYIRGMKLGQWQGIGLAPGRARECANQVNVRGDSTSSMCVYTYLLEVP